ncbi:MAG: hypothetical protein R2873_03850 [Caldilineaceae bacterium]
MQALRTSRFFVLLLALLVTLLAAACAAPAPAPSAGSGEEAATAEPMEESADAGAEPSRYRGPVRRSRHHGNLWMIKFVSRLEHVRSPVRHPLRQPWHG